MAEPRRSARLLGAPAVFYSELDESEEAQASRRATAALTSLEEEDGPLIDLMGE